MKINGTISIRQANLNDASAIAVTHVRSWQKIYRGIIPDFILDNLSIKAREQLWHNLINQNTNIMVIEENKALVGFASICAARDADLDPKKYGEISAIYLHPDVWQRGLGKKLCDAALMQLAKEGFLKVIVWVLKENFQARRFYEAIGFMWTGYSKEERTTQDFILNEIRFVKNFSHQFSFRRLQEENLDLLCTWLNKPHVKEWWNDKLSNDVIKTKYRERVRDDFVVPFIAYLKDKPIGFIQYYHADKVGNGWWPDEIAGTVGIDQFIGEEDYIGKGLGTSMIGEFIDNLFSNPNIKKIITDVDNKNKRAIHCYEKVGFTFVKELLTPDGLANLMQMTRNAI